MYINVIAAFSLPKGYSSKISDSGWTDWQESTLPLTLGVVFANHLPLWTFLNCRANRLKAEDSLDYSVMSRWWRQSHRVTGSSQLFSLDTQSYNTDEIHSSIGVVQWNSRHSGKPLGLPQPQLWILKFCVSHLDGWWRFFKALFP